MPNHSLKRRKTLIASILAFILLVSTAVVIMANSVMAKASTAQELAGHWRTESNPEIVALIQYDTIAMNFVGGDGHFPYWYGSFDKMSTENTIVSARIDSKLMASSALTKEFTYSDGKLLFEFTALGQTKTLELIRV